MVAKLKESTQVYSKDKETIAWLTHQDVKDPTKFAIVERFEHESSQKYHLENPYWSTWNPEVEVSLDSKDEYGEIQSDRFETQILWRFADLNRYSFSSIS